MTAQQTATALLAVINAAATPTAYDGPDKVPTPRPSEYIAITLTRMFGGVQRGCGTKALTGYRLGVIAVSEQSITNVRSSLEASRGALEYLRLTVGARTSTPIQFETETAAATKDGWSEGRQFFTLCI